MARRNRRTIIISAAVPGLSLAGAWLVFRQNPAIPAPVPGTSNISLDTGSEATAVSRSDQELNASLIANKRMP